MQIKNTQNCWGQKSLPSVLTDPSLLQIMDTLRSRGAACPLQTSPGCMHTCIPPLTVTERGPQPLGLCTFKHRKCCTCAIRDLPKAHCAPSFCAQVLQASSSESRASLNSNLYQNCKTNIKDLTKKMETVVQ